MARPAVIVSPHPRSVAETFDRATWSRLHDIARVVWGKDEPMPADAFAAALADARAVAIGAWPYSEGMLRTAGDNLIAIFEMMGTHDHPRLDYLACFDRGIRIGSIAPAFGPVVAEMCLALALAAGRGVGMSDRRFRLGSEEYLHAGNEGAVSLFGKTVGFVGCGSISRSLQALLEPFGVAIVGYDPWLEPAELSDRGIIPVALDVLFARADVIFILAVPTPANEKMISEDLMALLEPSDVLVVASRAHLVDFDALTRHILAGHFRAGIDVYPEEPLPGDHPIRTADGAVLTAHLAGALPETLHEIGRMIVDDFEAILAGRVPDRLQYATPELISSLRPGPR